MSRAEIKEKVSMPNPDFLVRAFYYEKDSKPGYIFDPHWHEHIEFITIMRGSMVIELEDHSYTLQKGNILIVNPNMCHTCETASPDLALQCVIADPTVFHSLQFDACEHLYLVPLLQSRILLQDYIANDSFLSDSLAGIVKENEEKLTGHELQIKSLLFSILAHLFRNYKTNSISKQSLLIRTQKQQCVQNALSYIRANYMNNIHIEDIADSLFINKYYLCKIFKSFTGRTLVEDINSCRINEAINLLLNTDKTISEIAISVGYNEINYFSRIFKKYTNMPPTAIRK